MSGIYIPIEMPETCEECSLESFCDKWVEARKMCGEWKLGVKATIRHRDCPLIPVPPHGRLIDADALKTDLTRFYAGEVTARHLIDEQPTIIPEEEDEA